MILEFEVAYLILFLAFALPVIGLCALCGWIYGCLPVRNSWVWLHAGRDWSSDVRRYQLFIALLPRPGDTAEGEIIRCWKGWDIRLTWLPRISPAYRWVTPPYDATVDARRWTGRYRELIGWQYRGWLRAHSIGDRKTPGLTARGDGWFTFNEGEYPNFYARWRGKHKGFYAALGARLRAYWFA